MTSKLFEIQPATLADSENVRLFLRTYYIRVGRHARATSMSVTEHSPHNMDWIAIPIANKKDSPLNKCLQVAPCTEIEDWGCSQLTDECSFKAVDDAGEIIGLLLNCIISKTVCVCILCSVDPVRNECWVIRTLLDCLQKKFLPILADDCPPNYRRLMAFFRYLESGIDLFAIYPDCERALDVGIMSVSSEYRGAGVAQALLAATMQRASEMTVPLCYCICSSVFSGRACAKAGFVAIHAVKYDDYRDEQGKRSVRPEEPHDEAVLWAKRMWMYSYDFVIIWTRWNHRILLVLHMLFIRIAILVAVRS